MRTYSGNGFRAAAWVVLAFVGCAGCQRSTPPAVMSREIRSELAEIDARVQLPSTEECEAWAGELDAEFRRGEYQRLTSAFDDAAIFERSAAGLALSERMRADVWAGFQQNGFGAELTKKFVESTAGGGTFRFLRVHDVGSQRRAWFRLVGLDGINYVDLVLAKRTDGTVAIVDCYSLLSGEMSSTTMRRALLPLTAKSPNPLLDRLSGNEQVFVKNFDKYEQVVSDFRARDWPAALEAYERLPQPMKEDKNLLLIRYQAANQWALASPSVDGSTSDAERALVDALNDFQQYHPRDPCLSFVLIDRHLIQKEYDKALRAVDRIEKQVGGDPYLDCVRGNIERTRGDLAAAKRLHQTVIDAGADLRDPYWGLIDVALAESDHDRTAELLEQMEARHGQVAIEGVPGYEEFLKSEQYRGWIRRRAARPFTP
jgi:hypothetical protein